MSAQILTLLHPEYGANTLVLVRTPEVEKLVARWDEALLEDHGKNHEFGVWHYWSSTTENTEADLAEYVENTIGG